MPATYLIGGDRGGTTAGDPKGTGDGDQYPPLPFGPEAFGSLGDLAGGPTMDDYFYIKDMYGTNAAEWYLKYGRGKYNPHIPGGGYVPFAPYVNKAQVPTLPSPLAGAADGTEIAFFGGNKNKNAPEFAFFSGNKNKNAPPPPPTKRSRKGTTDATKASTGMYPNMTPEIFFQKYGMIGLFIGKFIGPVRPLLPITAGSLSMNIKSFIIIEVFSCYIWA